VSITKTNHGEGKGGERGRSAEQSKGFMGMEKTKGGGNKTVAVKFVDKRKKQRIAKTLGRKKTRNNFNQGKVVY